MFHKQLESLSGPDLIAAFLYQTLPDDEKMEVDAALEAFKKPLDVLSPHALMLAYLLLKPMIREKLEKSKQEAQS